MSAQHGKPFSLLIAKVGQVIGTKGARINQLMEEHKPAKIAVISRAAQTQRRKS
jgi:transcription antitermination factor NusA-like protein